MTSATGFPLSLRVKSAVGFVGLVICVLTHPGPLTFFSNTAWLALACFGALYFDFVSKIANSTPYFIAAGFGLVQSFAIIAGLDLGWELVLNTLPAVMMVFLGAWLFCRYSSWAIDNVIFWTTVAAAFFTFLFYAWLPFLPLIPLPMIKGTYQMSFPFIIMTEYPRWLNLPNGLSIPFFRSNSFFFEQGAYSFFLIWASIIGLRRAKSNHWYKVSVLVFFMALLLSGSVGGLVTYIGAMGAEILGSRGIATTNKFVGLIFVGIMVGLLIGSEGNFTIEDRLNSDSYGDREKAVKAMMQKFLDSPVIPQINEDDTSISSFVSILGQFKIVGAFFLVVLVFKGLWVDLALLICLIGSASHQPLSASVLFYYVAVRLILGEPLARNDYVSQIGRLLFARKVAQG